MPSANTHQHPVSGSHSLSACSSRPAKAEWLESDEDNRDETEDSLLALHLSILRGLGLFAITVLVVTAAALL